jgi:hypothetical protein
MAVAMFLTWQGVTKEQYDEARRIVNWDNDHPDGALFHVSAFDDQGIHVFDLWESAEQFNAFAENRLMPAVAQAGMAGQPEIVLQPVHGMFTPGFQPT